MSDFLISPYINFGGRADEALEFYHRALGGRLNAQAKRLETDGGAIVGVDGHPKFPAKVGENIAVTVSGSNRERMQTIFDALADGGRVKGKLTRQEWGGETGYLEDRFGINWVVTVDG